MPYRKTGSLALIATAWLLINCVASENTADCTQLGAMAASSASLQAAGWIAGSTSGCCAWNFVTCNPSGDVVSLIFDGAALNGTCPSINLLNLSYLKFSSTNFTGAMPIIIAPSLNQLEVVATQFSNFVPNFPESLENLYIQNNPVIQGNPFDTIVNHCPNLTLLAITDNPGFAGAIPSMTSCSSLEIAYFPSNGFSGSVSEFAPSVKKLVFSQNVGLYWSPLQVLIAQPNLEFFDGSYTSGSGIIPTNISLLTPNLTEIFLSQTSISGEIPASLFQLARLKSFVADYAHLAGVFPDVSSNSLQFLNIEYQAPPAQQGTELRSDHFFSILTNMTNLKYVFFRGNPGLGGSIPANISLLSGLKQLYFSDCNITGVIPDQFCDLTQLGQIYMSANPISGSIPLCFGNLVKLSELGMSDLKLEGSIPASMVQLTELVQISLAGSGLSGTIPIGFNKLQKLSYINLEANNFTGCPGTFWFAQDECRLLQNPWDENCVLCPIGPIPPEAYVPVATTTCSDNAKSCNFVCSNDVAVSSVCSVQGSPTISGSTTLVVNSSQPVLVAGNLTISSGVKIQFTLGSNGSDPLLKVQQCLNLGSNQIDVVVPAGADLAALNNSILIEWNALCANIPSAPQISSNLDVCTAASEASVRDSSVGPTGRLSLVFLPVEPSSAASRCSPASGSGAIVLSNEAIIGIAIAAAVVGVIIIVAVVFGIRAVRRKVMPYRDRQHHKTDTL